ncbi:MAG: type III pantothenate kinase [Verrucomicrobiota bacterium]|nr:type III pantothenate kinase [Verrucomicrobiota bacterium]
MSVADFLLVDNSNSFTKLALSSREKLGRIARIRTRELTGDRLRKTLQGWSFQAAVLSSVVPDKREEIARSVGRTPLLLVGPHLELGVGIDYPRPKTIGADRLANAVSAAHFFGAPVVVVDFGTAVSFDIVSAERNYVGGVIAPGLEAMTDYLHQRTALLPKIDLLEPPGAIGKSTRHAMLAGAVYGYRGLVRQILVEIRRELVPGRKKLRIVGTGGYAELIAAGLPEIDSIQPHLTLEGLRLIANLNL